VTPQQTGDPVIGNRIRAARLQAGLSQERLATKIGKGQPSVSGFESGAIAPEPKTLKLLSRALDVSVDYLLNGPTGAGMPRELEKLADQLMGSLQKRHWRAAKNLAPGELQQAVDEFAALLEAKGKSRAKTRRSPRR
jgi:transcriptional regulator with XRE-family HTH domain